ncbi:uncharacterized protein WM277_019047 isoform 2-T3 [Molossus nigricans]
MTDCIIAYSRKCSWRSSMVESIPGLGLGRRTWRSSVALYKQVIFYCQKAELSLGTTSALGDRCVWSVSLSSDCVRLLHRHQSYKDREREDINGEGINGGSFFKLVPPIRGTLNTAACPNPLPGVSQVESGFLVCKA